MKGLGQRIKALRKTRKLTLVEIAKRTAIDQATLSRIENGVMVGTLESHTKIADALGVRLPDLYNDVLTKIQEPKEKEIKRKMETFSHSTGAVAELLTTSILQKKMMPVLLKLKPKARTESEEFSAGTERFIYVIKGKLELTIEKNKQLILEKESLYFNGALPHYFLNASKSETACLSVITPSSL